LSSPRPYRNSIAALRIVANGLALSCTQQITIEETNFKQSYTSSQPSVTELFDK
jgi:hypothetical protein